MAKIVVLITSSPGESANGLVALRYCQAALSLQHDVSVFFYAAGAHIANGFTTTASDELNLTNEFSNLYEQHDKLRLIVCNTAANRRGLIAEEEKVKSGFNILPPFESGGLAEFAQMSQDALRVVQF